MRERVLQLLIGLFLLKKDVDVNYLSGLLWESKLLLTFLDLHLTH